MAGTGEPGPVGHHNSQRVRIWEGCDVGRGRESIEGGVTLYQEHYPVSARGGLIIYVHPLQHVLYIVYANTCTHLHVLNVR